MMEWLWGQFLEALKYPPFAVGIITLALGMGLVEFTARMLPANMAPTIAVRVSWTVAFAVSCAVGSLLNHTDFGLAVALTISILAPSAQVYLMRFLYARYPQLQPQSMCENPNVKPGDPHWPD